MGPFRRHLVHGGSVDLTVTLHAGGLTRRAQNEKFAIAPARDGRNGVVTMPTKPEVRVTERDATRVTDMLGTVGEPHIAIRTGLTEGKTFDILIRPVEGRPVLIAVHL